MKYPYDGRVGVLASLYAFLYVSAGRSCQEERVIMCCSIGNACSGVASIERRCFDRRYISRACGQFTISAM